uniref:Leptin n=1 Tax=Denticeps clupeoides TaxID=299321 RepID=A0AAY4CZQ2_9TELE
MSGFSALLGFCLLAALTASKAKPVSDNIRQQINTIETRIRAHMDENPMKILIPLPEVVPIDQPISGLMSTLETLGAFQKMVDSLLKGQPQLSVDLKTLRSHLELAMGELPCPHKKVDKEHHKELDSFLMANETYPQYMVKLLQSLDQLRTLLRPPPTPPHPRVTKDSSIYAIYYYCCSHYSFKHLF